MQISKALTEYMLKFCIFTVSRSHYFISVCCFSYFTLIYNLVYQEFENVVGRCLYFKECVGIVFD